MILELLLIFLTALAFWYMKQRRIFKAVEHIPGPTPLPFIGNALEFGTNTVDILPKLEKLVQDYGSVVRLCLGTHVIVILAEPKYIGQVLTSTDSFYKADVYELIKPFVGEGLITSTGELWNRHRRILSPAFSNKSLIKFTDIFNKTTNALIQQLKGQVKSQSFDITDPIFNCTFNIICKTAMNVDITKYAEYHAALNKFLELITIKYFSPLKRIYLLYRFSNNYRLEQKYLETLNSNTKYVIASRKEVSKQDAVEKDVTILDQLFNLSEADALTDQEIQDEVQTFIFAGSDTIGTSMSLGLFELAKHPSVQKKILEETNTILGTEKDVDIKFEDAHDLKYTDCVFKEVLRLYSPIPFTLRTSSKEYQFGDFAIPPGTNVMLFHRRVHLSEKVFPSPDQFDPDRFLPENSFHRDVHSFVPFSGGPRVCIGQKYAMLEAKIILAKIVRNFELIPVQPEHKPLLVGRGILKSANGLPIKLKVRL